MLGFSIIAAVAFFAAGYFFGEWYGWVILGVAVLAGGMAGLASGQYRKDLAGYLILCLLDDAFAERASGAYKVWLRERSKGDIKGMLFLNAIREMQRIVQEWAKRGRPYSGLVSSVWEFKHGSTDAGLGAT